MEAGLQRTGFLAQGGRWQGPQEAEETEQARRRGLGSETAEARPERKVGPSHMDSSPLPPEEAEAARKYCRIPRPSGLCKDAGKEPEAGSPGRAHLPMLSKQNQELKAPVQAPDYKCLFSYPSGWPLFHPGSF